MLQRWIFWVWSQDLASWIDSWLHLCVGSLSASVASVIISKRHLIYQAVAVASKSHQTPAQAVQKWQWPISCLLLVQWRRWVSFWKALIVLYRFGVYSVWLDDYSQIVPVKNGSRKWSSGPDSAQEPDFQSRGQNNQNQQIDHHSNRLFALYRLVLSLRTKNQNV